MSRSGDVKIGRARAKEICELPLNALNVGMKAELIQALIPIGLWHVKGYIKLREREAQVVGSTHTAEEAG
jgi:hypothetical protein